MKGGGEHRRGRSMGSTTPRAESKDEDLALFHEMKRREKHNFLHPSPDDLDVSLSKKSGTDLLTSDVDKNDYDWLLTPPGTPLFPSLDQEAAALGVISPPASLLGSSSANATKLLHSPADPSPKSTRGNPSPRRSGSTTPNGTMSRSRSTPHNSTSVVANVSRPSTPTSSLTRPSTPTAKTSSTPSVRSSTPNLKLSISASKSSSSTASTPTATRPSTPNARSSTPPVRPSTPGARSSTPTSKPSTPTMRRSLSGGRIASSPATTRGGPSPKRTTSSRGNSPSAKRVTPVITTVPGMCSEAPPNLRTTVPERTSSTPKSSSNGSRSFSESGHGPDAMDTSGRSRRRPRSPSVSRSFSSSSSQDQRTSSQTSRGSVISSYDDGIEVSRPTLQSSRNSAAGKWHAPGHEDLLSGKANTNVQAKRVTKSMVMSGSSSVSGGTPTKKSLEPNKWQGEAYQHSPSSYRHLVASSPGSPFYGSRANSLLVRPASAMNSSVTTSSNASSEHGTTVAPDTEGSERDDDDLLSWDSYGRRMSPSPRGRQADILTLDKDDEKLGAWQDYERLNSNDLVASYKPGVQSTLDTEVTSFYESDGMASFEMLEQLGLMGEVYATKKGAPGERVLERRASNIEDGKAELRRSGEKTLQRRGSNIEDSRIPELHSSDDGSGLTRANNNKSSHDGQINSAQQGLKSKRQELLDSLNETRKYEGDSLRKSGQKALGPQKSKVSSAEIHAACLFVRDFRVGLAPPQGQEIPSAVPHTSSVLEEESTSMNWLGDGGGGINRSKDFGNVRQTHDFSQQKLQVSGGGSALAKMESKLPRRPQARGKVANPEPAVAHIQDGSSTADILQLQVDEEDSANNSALSVLVDVMERIKHESSQPKYLDLENQVSNTGIPTGVGMDNRLRMPTHSQTSETQRSQRGLSYEEIHAMDEVDTPELHDIEDDSLMYDGGKDELELLESLHRSALRKEEVRAMREELPHESPKRRFFTAEEAEISSLEVGNVHDSPKRRCVEVTGDGGLHTRDAVLSHGSPRFLHEEVDVAITSIDLDDFLGPGEHNDLEVEGEVAITRMDLDYFLRYGKHNDLEDEGGDTEESEILVGRSLLPQGHKGDIHELIPTDKMDVPPTFERDTPKSVAGIVIMDSEHLSSIGVRAFEEGDCTALGAVPSVGADAVHDLGGLNSDMDWEKEPDVKVGDSVFSEVQDAHTVMVNTSSPIDVDHQAMDECRKDEKVLSEQTDRLTVDEQFCESTARATDVAHCSEDLDKRLEGAKHMMEGIFPDDANEVFVHQEVGDSSPLSVGASELESLSQTVVGGNMEENLPLESSTSPRLEDEERSSRMLLETNHPVSWMDQPTLPSLQSAVNSTKEEESTEPSGTTGAKEVNAVNIAKEFHSEHLLTDSPHRPNYEKGHQDGSVAGVLGNISPSTEISFETFVEGSEEHSVQVGDPVSDIVPDTAKECSLSSADEMEENKEHVAVSDASYEFKSTGKEGLHLENDLAEDLDSSESDEIASVDSLDYARFLGDPASELASLSKPVGTLSKDVPSQNLHVGREHYYLEDSIWMDTSENGARDVDLSPETARSEQNASEVTGSVRLRQSVNDSDAFLSNVSEPSLKLHETEKSQSLEYVDTKSVETSDYYEATSEEKAEAYQEVSSGTFAERNEVGFVHPNALSPDGQTGISEVVPKPKSRLSSSLSEMRSASSICAALEEQLAGLIQKIDSAIEESSKPFLSGQQEGMIGRDKLSVRTSELLREQEPDDAVEPVRSSQEEDLLDMLWAEDDDSGNSEGSGEDEFFQLNESKPSGKDGTPNQVNGEIRLSRSSENGLTLYSNGHPTDLSQDLTKVSSPVFAEDDVNHMDSTQSCMEEDEVLEDMDITSPGSLPVAALTDSTGDPDEKVGEHLVIPSLAQPDSAKVPELSAGDHLKDPSELPLSSGRDTESSKEARPDSMDTSEDERDASVKDIGEPDGILCLHDPLDDISEPVSPDGVLSLEAFLSPHQLMTVDAHSAGEEVQPLEEETCTDDHPVGQTVKGVEDFVSQNSSSCMGLVKEEPQDSEAGPVAGQGEVDDTELVEQDVGSANVGLSENVLLPGAPTEIRVPEASVVAEEDSGCEDWHTGDQVYASKFGLFAEQDLMQSDSIVAEEPQRSGKIGDVEEHLSRGYSSEDPSVGEAEEVFLMVEESETTNLRPTEQNLPGEDEVPQELLLVEKKEIEASEGRRTEDGFSCEEKDIAEYFLPVSEVDPLAELSVLDNDLEGERSKERTQEEVVADVAKDSTESLPVLSGSLSPIPSDVFFPEIPERDTSHPEFDEDDSLTSTLQLICSEDGYLGLDESALKEDLEVHKLVNEGRSPPLLHDSPVALVLPSEPTEQSEQQRVPTFANESEKLSDRCEVPISGTDDDLSKLEIHIKPQVSEGSIDKETRLEEPSSSLSSATVQRSSDLEKGSGTDEDSYQECISHDSNSLSISRGSLTVSSEQETFSAGTQGVGEEEQEETSKMQFAYSSEHVDEGFGSQSQRETMADVGSDDKLTVPEKMDLVNTPELPSSDRPLDHSEEDRATDSSMSPQDDTVMEVVSNSFAENSNQVDRDECVHQSMHSMHSEASGDARMFSVSEPDTAESHSLQEEGMGIGLREISFISLGESPCCTGSSDVHKNDEAGSVDSHGTEKLSKSFEVSSASPFSDKLEYQLSPSVSESHLSDKEEFRNIEDSAWVEQVGEKKSFPSSDGRWSPSESLEPSEKSHTGNGPDQPEVQKNLPSSERAWNSTESLSQIQMPLTANGEDVMAKPERFSEDSHLLSPSTVKEEVTRSLFQSAINTVEVTPAERVTSEAVEPKVKNEGEASSDTGISNASVIADKMNGVGSQSARKLPISKAKSVRTMSLTSSSQNELASDVLLSPDTAVPVPKSTAYTSVTVVSPENLQWEPSRTGVPLSGHTGTDDSASAGNEVGMWSAQGVNSSPASVRRALAMMGQQTSSFTPTDTCLHSPPTQMFERDAKSPDKGGGIPGEKATATEETKGSIMKSPPKVILSPAKEMKPMDASAHTAIEVGSKKDFAPMKAPKAKCSCTIM